MNRKQYLNHLDMLKRCQQLARRLAVLPSAKCYPIPRGGIPCAYLLSSVLPRLEIVDSPEKATFFLDDIIDSGETKALWKRKFPTIPFYALVDKLADPQFHGDWIVFPWESDSESGIESNITRLLQYIGEDPTRNGLAETPRRVTKAWDFWTSGYGKDPAEILKVFEDGAEGYDEMVTVKDIPFYSHCEHHLAPFFGTASISYIPSGRIVGLSKLSRLVDLFGRRLQVQERFTNQIADAIMEHLNPKGVGVLVQARHMCMESRGICQQGHSTITSALRGALKDDPSARAEFLTLAGK